MRRTLSLLLIFLPLIAASPRIKADTIAHTLSPDAFETLKEEARKSEAPDDWRRVIDNARVRKDTADLGFAYVSYLQAMANMRPAGFKKEARPIMDFLFESRQYDYYFALYNLFISRLFSDQAYRQAQEEAKLMYRQAREIGQPIGMAMALRVQGQIFYKLNLYDKAYSVLREGARTCPSYEESLNAFTTAQSLCEWQIMTCRKTGRIEEMLPLTDLYGEMLAYWNGKGWRDPSGHYPVTHLALRAIALLETGRREEARDCLRQARIYMLPTFPARAYEHFYEARYLLCYEEGAYKEAIADIDTLIETHRDYFPFYLNDIQAKAELLSLSGQPRQSIQLYRDYIQANDSIAKEEIARQLDELRVQYEVEKAQQENRQTTRYLQLAFVIIGLVSLLLLLYIIYAYKLNAKNRLLVARLEERDKWTKNFSSPELGPGLGELSEDTKSSGLSTSREIVQRLETFMIDERPYRNPALNRKELAKALQMNEQTLANAIREENNQTVSEYITMHRLENARHLLSLEDSVILKDIAEQCGFGTLRTFQRSFRDRYGMPPSQYRKIASEKKENPLP